MHRVVVLAAVLALLAACNKKTGVQRSECDVLLEHFIALKLSEHPGTKRDEVRAQIESDSDVQQVTNHCDEQVTRAEYDCAIKATSSEQWNACIE
jgi:hypothetical protein